MERLIIFFCVALAEWVISVVSLRLIAKGRIFSSLAVIFLENMLGYWVFFQFVESLNDWALVTAYSLGASLGTGIGLYLTRDLKEG